MFPRLVPAGRIFFAFFDWFILLSLCRDWIGQMACLWFQNRSAASYFDIIFFREGMFSHKRYMLT